MKETAEFNPTTTATITSIEVRRAIKYASLRDVDMRFGVQMGIEGANVVAYPTVTFAFGRNDLARREVDRILAGEAATKIGVLP